MKTSSSAKREYTRKKEPGYWLWDVGARALKTKGDNLLYAFVDLRGDELPEGEPSVYIVPSETVCQQLNAEDTRYMFWIVEGQEHEYKERWDRIEDALSINPTSNE